MPTVRIPYRPNPAQVKFDRAADKAMANPQIGHLSAVAGFGTGKTYWGAMRAVRCAFANPGRLGIVVSPSFPLAKMASGAISHVRGILESAEVEYRFNKSDNELYIPMVRSTIQFISSTYPERLVSITAAWAWCDEPGMYKAEVLPRVITRLRDKDAPCRIMFCTGTPEGFNQFYDYTIRNAPANHYHIKGATLDNIDNLADDYIDNLKEQFPEQALKAYLNGEFVNLTSGAVYYAYERDTHQKRIDFDPARDVYLSCDFNVNPMAWNIYQVYTAREMTAKYPTMRFQDQVLVCPSECEISMRQADTAGAAMVVADKLKAFGWHGGTLRLYGDATGKNKSTKSHRSDYDILQAVLKEQMQGLNTSYNVPLGQPSQRDSINAVNGRLRNGKGEVGLLLDPSNVNLNDDLEQVVYDKSGGIDKSMETGSNPRVHWQDNLRYLVHRAFPAIIHRTTSRTY